MPLTDDELVVIAAIQMGGLRFGVGYTFTAFNSNDEPYTHNSWYLGDRDMGDVVYGLINKGIVEYTGQRHIPGQSASIRVKERKVS